MRVTKLLLTILLAMLLLVDAIGAARLVRFGWPKELIVAASNHTAQVQAVPMHMNVLTWILCVLYGVVHLNLGLRGLASMEV